MFDESFTESVRAYMETFLESHKPGEDAMDLLRIDLHCHDHNSDVPDELLARILRCPETWVSSEEVLRRLEAVGQRVFTITNHNNARSCWALKEKGVDVVSGAEFTCRVPENDATIHVLAFGFSPSQEERLNALRSDVYQFQSYAQEMDIPTSFAHPLFVYDPKNAFSIEMLEKLSLIFDNFEVLNGQRDAWQMVLMTEWIQGLTAERIEELSKKHRIEPQNYCRRPFRKAMTAGSDCHMGMFVGGTGTAVRIPDLAYRLQRQPASELVLEGLRRGSTTIYGNYAGPEKMTSSLLSFFCQMTMYMADPGLVRMLLHKGSSRDKLIAFLISNSVMELRRHTYTSRFLRTLQDAFGGKRPGFMIRRMTSREYRPLVVEMEQIATAAQKGPVSLQAQLSQSIPSLFDCLCRVLSGRVERRIATGEPNETTNSNDTGLPRFEIPSHIRKWISLQETADSDSGRVNLAQWTDGLPFPALAAASVLGAHFTATRVQFANRPFLNQVASHLGCHEHPQKALWLSDTYFDRNGVANSLQLMHRATREYNLPVDFVVGADNAKETDGLKVLSPCLNLDVPFYREQTLRFVNLLELDAHFLKGGYDRIVCSTEGPMGICALYLKMAHSIPAYFFLHTDWIEYAQRSLSLDARSLDYLRRSLRWFYHQFDGIFVLNREQQHWLCDRDMNIDPDKVHLTAHWCDPRFFPGPVDRTAVAAGLLPKSRVLLYSGRLSDEKGVMEIPDVYHAVKTQFPDTQLLIAGTGPAEARLREAVPEAIFTGWVDKTELAQLYRASDVLLFPSRFDTFGNSVLEALSCGLPVVAYNTKGPADIIENDRSGFLVVASSDFAASVIALFSDPHRFARMRLESIQRSRNFDRATIVQRMLRDLRMDCIVQTDAARLSLAPVTEERKIG